jgi:hypothetical protein
VKNSLTDVLTKIRAYRQGIEDEDREFDPEAKRRDRTRRSPAPPAAPTAVAGFVDPGPGQEPEEPS